VHCGRVFSVEEIAGIRQTVAWLPRLGRRALAVRDHWIGWDAQTRRANQVRVLNNSRFLIFPHVQVPHLASHVLGQLARPARRVSRSVWRECRCVRCGVQDSGT
jgi:hypothetical protein